MSKPEITPEQLEEEYAAEEEEEEEVDTTIANSDVVVKYKKAGVWANEALQAVIADCKEGAKVGELCKKGDDTIKAKLATSFKGVDKGIAFPTCVSVNSCVAHNSPDLKDDPESYNAVIKLNDIVHIDLGIQVDGFVAQVAHTIQVTTNGELAPDTKETNILTAAYETVQNAIRAFRPENSLYDVTEMIEGIAATYGVNVVEGVLSHNLKQFIIDSARCIPAKNIPEQKVHNYNFEPASVWTLDVAFTTGKGKLKEKDTKTAVYKSALDQDKFNSRIQAAEEVRKEITATAQTFPFSVRNLEHKRTRLGLSELTRHNVMIPYPVLFEKENEIVAHFKITLFITDKKIERISGIPMQKGAQKKTFESNESLLAASKAPMTFAKKEKKKAE